MPYLHSCAGKKKKKVGFYSSPPPPQNWILNLAHPPQRQRQIVSLRGIPGPSTCEQRLDRADDSMGSLYFDTC